MEKFDRFIKENDAKRQRAVMKVQAEKKQQELKEGELRALQQINDQQKEILSKLRRQTGTRLKLWEI
jgi:hypothetical protein